MTDVTDRLDAIQKRYDASQEAMAEEQELVTIRIAHRLSESANDVPFLLELARKQQAALEALSNWAGRNRTGFYDEAQDDVVQILREALEAKP